MLRTMERPTKAILRLYLCAESMICWMRWTWLAKLETTTRRGAVRMTPSMAGIKSASAAKKPGTSALVESGRNKSTPSSPRRAKPARSVMRLSSGNWSILKSPVSSTRPAGVRMATAKPSGMEWLTARNSTSKGPNLRRSPSLTWIILALIRCSSSLVLTKAKVSLAEITGMSPRSLSRYGTPPMWSSWPWVRTRPTTSCHLSFK